MLAIYTRIPFGSIAFLIVAFFFTTSIHGQVLDSSRKTGAEIKTFHSKILGENRKIVIQTPSRMNVFDKYPVLYLLDGEAHATMVNGQVQYLSEAYKIIPNMIVVAIENTDRMRDLTPSHFNLGPDGKPDTSARAFGKNSGGGEKFLQFIKQELMPYIETHYPTAPYKILSGHSLGGLMAVYCLVNHPDYFNAYIAISPSLQWDQEFMLNQVAEKLSKQNLNNRILYFSDANEDAAFHLNQVKLDSLLKLKNISGLKYKHFFYPEETHISEPVKAFYDGIRFVYPNWHLPYNSSAFRKTMSSDIIKNHFTALAKTYGYNAVPLHDDIIMISRFLRNDPNRIKDAIDLLEMNLINHPKSAITYETLGDTWMKLNDTKKAMKAYQKALLIDTKNETVMQKIKNITK